jgi:hypothetical protein
VAATELSARAASGRAAPARTASLIAIWLVAAAPFLIVSLPPVMDLPNHLTRIWLLAGGLDHPPLAQMYEARWGQAATNVFVDLIGVGLAHLVPIAAVGKVLLLAMFFGPPLAALKLHTKLFGRTGWWALAGIAIVWSTTAVTGLISYQIALTAALGVAAWLHPLTDLRRRLIVVALGAAVLLFIHPFGALFFLLLLTGLALGPRVPLRAQWPQLARRIAALTLACLVPVVVLILVAPHPPSAHGTHQEFMHWQAWKTTFSPTTIGLVILSPFLSYKASLDLVLALPLFGVIAWAAYRRQLEIHAGLLLVAAALEVVSPFLPMNIGDGGALVIRFPEMAALLGLAGVRPAFRAPHHQSIFAGVLVLAALLRIGSIGWTWHLRDADYDQLKSVARALPPGASVLLLQQHWSESEGTPIGRLIAGFPSGRCASERHYASLIVMWRQVFIPSLFTVPGQQPLAVKPAYRDKAVYSTGIPFIGDMNTASRRQFDPYLDHWQKKYDYVLLLNADLGRTPLPGTRIVADSGFARLYQVNR